MSFLRTSTLIALAAGLLAVPLEAQLPTPAPSQTQLYPGEPADLIDRVVAIVGDSAIFLSDVVDEVQVYLAQQGVEPPRTADGMRRMMEEALESLVNLELILQEAAKDSTLLTDDAAIEEQVEAAVGQIQQQFPSLVAFQDALAESGLTPTLYREQLRTRIRRTQIQQLFFQRRLPTVPAVAVTEDEMRELFEQQRSQLQQRPEELRLEQILLQPTASDEAWSAAEAKADSLRTAIMEGEDFAEVARVHSQDPGSAANGGDLDWFRRGMMVREFEEVAFGLPDGQVSFPVRTDFGWHIIRVERSRPGEVKARHILIIPETSDQDLVRTQALADSLAERVRAGDPVEPLHEEFGQADQPSTFSIPRNQIASELPPGYGEALATAGEGEVVGPFTSDLGGRQYLVVIRVAEVREAGEFTFEDFREPIRNRIQQEKRMERLVAQLRAGTHIEIRF
jgi:peptidyl-prolyl cis-trans isomerase SurA